ncbi:MAG: esterase [Lachnospiraceae bacterium]|nr:esterase [Lachnospiraceae bacterium]
MKTYEYGNPSSGLVLIQPVDAHDLQIMESEVGLIADKCGQDFKLVAVLVDDWNADLSPWEADAVFGKVGFAGGSADTLREVLNYCSDSSKTYLIGGYSLAGLFSLWAAFNTDVFKGVAAASPSVWFPNFTDYMKEHDMKASHVYLSLGDREEKTKNPVMARVGDCIRQANDVLISQGVDTHLTWNVGNHFKDSDVRTAKAFAWLIGRIRQ